MRGGGREGGSEKLKVKSEGGGARMVKEWFLLRTNNIFYKKCIVYATFLLSLHHITRDYGYAL
jgi:hypothetical protein